MLVDTDVRPEKFVDDVARNLLERSPLEITVDLTQGFRHFSLLIFSTAVFLQTLGRTKVAHCYYAMLQDDSNQKDQRSEVLDLAPLIRLQRFAYMVNAFRERLDLEPLVDQIGQQLESTNHESARQLRLLASTLNLRLPLDVASVAADFEAHRKPITRSLNALGIPASKELTDLIMDAVADRKLPGATLKQKPPALTKPLLEKLAEEITRALDRNDLAAFYGNTREWLVSWLLWRTHGDNFDRWLRHDERARAERCLTALTQIYDDFARPKTTTGARADAGAAPELTEDQARLARVFKALAALRNRIMHAGMAPQLFADLIKNHESLADEWRNWLSHLPEFDPTPTGGNKSVLVSPIGKTPGAFYSALVACQPPAELVICLASEQTIGFVAEACDRANRHPDLLPVIFADPMGGLEEARQLTERKHWSDSGRSIARNLVFADHVYVNLTGGTTLLGWTAAKLAEIAERYGRDVKRMCFIDPRERDEQRRDPWVSRDPLFID
ncbi:MAG: TM1812 family CRISPR-associated protein [Acidimicrobiales bacterium]|nr:TM1812 family CRISPR-associated protein [Acidimicrobiales bacterium]